MSETGGKGHGIWIIAAAPIIIFTMLIAIVILIVAPASACGTGMASRVDPDDVPSLPVAGYSGEQLENAALIMNAAVDLGLDRNAQVLGVQAAMGESSLINIDYGDEAGPDSRGLFQQRDSWGTLEERMDPTTAATMFFEALMLVPGWDELEPTIAIHRVQRNADPYHYESYGPAAEQVVSVLAGVVGSCPTGDLVFPLSPGFNMTSDYGPRPVTVVGASSWHAAIDLQHYPGPCGDPVFAITEGRVTFVGSSQVTIKHPAGYDVMYLHMWPTDVLVEVGDGVAAGDQIGAVGNAGVSGGCHIDLRIRVLGNTDPRVAELPQSQEFGAPSLYWYFVNPEDFYALWGIELCNPTVCSRPPLDGTEIPRS